MLNKRLKKILTSSCFALAFGAASATAETLRVEIDTSAYANVGWIDLLFNPSSLNGPLATVKVFDFTGFDTSLPAQTDGGAAGSLTSGYTLDNLRQGSELFHAVNLGGKIGFSVDFNGDAGSAINRSLSTLGIALYGPDQTTLLGNGDPATGSLVHLNWFSPTSTTPGSVSTRIFDGTVSVGPVSVSPVPEPSVWLTMGAGLGLLALVRRRKVGAPFGVPMVPALTSA